MNKRSALIRFTAVGLTAALALIVGTSGAGANNYNRPPYPHYEVYTIHTGEWVQKYHWSNVGGSVKAGSAYQAVSICALNGQGGSRAVDLYKNYDAIPNPSNVDDNRYTFASKWQPNGSKWEFFKGWQIPICGSTSYNGGNPFASNGGYETGTGMGFGNYWFKIVARDATAPTIFCAGLSHKDRTDSLPGMTSTGMSCTLTSEHDRYMGDSSNDTQSNINARKGSYRIN